MKTLLYFLSGPLVVPGALLAYFFWTVTDATRQKNIFACLLFLFERFLDTLVWTTWIVLPGLILWVTLGFFPKYRWVGSSGVVLLAAVSIFEMFAASSTRITLDTSFVPVMSFIGLAINLWLIWTVVASSSGPVTGAG